MKLVPLREAKYSLEVASLMAEKGSHKILVTGGAGFVGSHVVDAYINAGHTVIIVDDLSTGSKNNINKKGKFYQVSIADQKALEEIFEKERPTIINHHAAQIDVRVSMEKPDKDADINIVGMIHLLECARKWNVQKFIFASSGGALYGEAPDKLPSENDPVHPLSHYGVSKLCGEHYLHLYAHLYNLTYTILRYSNIYGPRQNPLGEGGVIALFTHAMLEGKTPKIFGDGNQIRDFVYAGDVAEANLKAIEKGSGKTINIGNGKTTSINQLFDLLKELSPFQGKPLYQPKREGEIYQSRFSIAFAKNSLDWVPKTTIGEGLKKTMTWQNQQPPSTNVLDKP